MVVSIAAETLVRCFWLDRESEVGVPSLQPQLVGESTKEEIDMTANVVTHQCVCVCARMGKGGRQTGSRNSELHNKQDL